MFDPSIFSIALLPKLSQEFIFIILSRNEVHFGTRSIFAEAWRNTTVNLIMYLPKKAEELREIRWKTRKFLRDVIVAENLINIVTSQESRKLC